MTMYQVDFHSADEDVSAYTFFEAPALLDAKGVLCDIVQRRRANNLRGTHSLLDGTGKIVATYHDRYRNPRRKVRS